MICLMRSLVAPAMRKFGRGEEAPGGVGYSISGVRRSPPASREAGALNDVAGASSADI
jgi:hypothetical protein